MVVRTPGGPLILPADWNGADCAVWLFGAGGKGGAAGFFAILPAIAFGASAGGGGMAWPVLNFGFSPGQTINLTVAQGGSRPFGSGVRNLTTIEGNDYGGGYTGQNSGPEGAGPSFSTGVALHGTGGTVFNDGGDAPTSGPFLHDVDGSPGGNLQAGRHSGANDWADALAATPNVWFDPAGTGLDYDTVAALFPPGNVPGSFGGGGAAGLVAGVPNGGNGKFPGGAGGGGALVHYQQAGQAFGTAGLGADGLMLLYYNPAAPSVGRSQIYLLG